MSSDIGDMYASLKQDRQHRHADWHQTNTRILDESGIDYKKASHECYTFRGDRNADFYPSTGRWKNIDTGRMHSGGAQRFVGWYKREATG